MKFHFELYLKSNLTEKEQWHQFYASLSAHIGYMNQCLITMTIKDSVVRIFVSADRDLGVLSNNIDIGVLKPIKSSDCEPPQAKGAERLVSLSNVSNLLELREKTKLKRGKELEYVVLNYLSIIVEKSDTKKTLYFKKPARHYTINKRNLLT